MVKQKAMGDYLTVDQDYYDFYSPSKQRNPYNNDGWRDNHLDQNQHHISSYIQAYQARSNESLINK